MSTPGDRDPNLDDVRALLAVARTGRLLTAAEQLGVEHTTIRRRLDRLELALGARVLDRTAEGWELTAVGREVAARASELDAIVDAIAGAASGREATVRGSVRLLAPEAFALAFATPALARLRSEHPGILVELVTTTRELGPRGAGFDLAVTVGSPTGSRLLSEPLAPYALRLYASREYLAAHPPLRRVEDLAHHPLVFYVDALLSVRELDLTPLLAGMRVGFGATSAVAQVEATRHGAGIGLLHAFAAEHDPELVPVLPGEVEFRLRFSLSMRRESESSRAVLLAREALREEVVRRAAEFVPE